MIRHGQASFGEDNYDRLSHTGIRQAQVLARHLARVGQIFDAVYCGRMRRHKQTAQELLDYYEKCGLAVPQLVTSSDFDEYDSFAVWEAQIPQMLAEDRSLSEDLAKIKTDPKVFQRLFERVLHRWISGNFDPPGIPRWCDFKKRVCKGIEKLMQNHGSKQQILVFTSGGPICLAVQTALGLSDKKTL